MTTADPIAERLSAEFDDVPPTLVQQCVTSATTTARQDEAAAEALARTDVAALADALRRADTPAA